MKPGATILIADRNPHVREFLKREMRAEGYGVCLAKNASEVHDWIYNPEPVDLVILDPDLPGSDRISLLQELQDRIPSLPVVLHMFSFERRLHGGFLDEAVFVEKSGTSILHLKQVVQNLLAGSPPQKTGSTED